MTNSRIQIKDIVMLEKPSIPTISPDGTHIAYVVERSDIEANSVTNSLYIYDALNKQTESLLTADRIFKINWNKNICYLLTQSNHQYHLIKIEDKIITTIIASEQQLGSFVVSDDGVNIYYSRLHKTSAEIVKKNKEEGYVYRWNEDNSETIIFSKYEHHEYEEIIGYHTETNQHHSLASFPWKNWIEWQPDLEPLIKSMKLSSNASHLAVVMNRLGSPELGEAGFLFDLHVINIKLKTSEKLLGNNLTAKMTPCWVNDNELVFQEANYNQQEKEYNLWMWNALTKQSQQLKFTPERMIKSINYNHDKNNLYIESADRLHQLSLVTQNITDCTPPAEYFNSAWVEPSFTMDLSCQLLATIIENRSQPPEVALYDVYNQNITIISNLNKNINDIPLGKIEPITFDTESPDHNKVSARGYLLHPTNEMEGKRYPLIVATYGFRGKTCAVNAEEWHSTFPAQVFSAEGYYVLLLNRPTSDAQSNITDSKKAREDEGYNMLRIFELAVMLLIERGCIDEDKVGVYGWSHGAFIVQFLMAHSTKFKVACLGEGGDYNPAMAWTTGNKLGIEICNNLFGGPPWGHCLNNYVEFSPYFQVQNIKTPLLMEFAGGAVFALEMFVPLRHQNTPTELVFYEGEPHIFVKPKPRLASMQRKLDWFNFWFFDKKDSDNPEQYVRWSDMRDQALLKRGNQ